MDAFTIACIVTIFLGGIMIAALLLYNAFQLDRWERYETAIEMREAIHWADTRKMRKQHDYRAVLRGR